MEVKKYVCYTRVSTVNQGDNGTSLDVQLEICRRYVNSVSGEILGEFYDKMSGRSRHRPGLIKALEIARENNATIVFSRLDRLARDAEYSYMIKNSGVGLYFCDFPDIDSFVFGIMAAHAEKESENISKRIKASTAHMKKQIEENGMYLSKRTGKYIEKLGNPNLSKVQHLGCEAAGKVSKASKVNDKDWNKARGLAVYLRERGDTVACIADTLNELGHTTRTGGKWSKGTVSRLLKSVGDA
ncbi:hypothetical protein PF672P2_00062 [Parabacteroides phage PF672P2]|nr:hypothetical protein PF672P1_00019 [Parabacteroides phage PF672P1]WAX17199.1 hypothetical protein PF672P2_00062 [Parabacteroides phage PF672P2]